MERALRRGRSTPAPAQPPQLQRRRRERYCASGVRSERTRERIDSLFFLDYHGRREFLASSFFYMDMEIGRPLRQYLTSSMSCDSLQGRKISPPRRIQCSGPRLENLPHLANHPCVVPFFGASRALFFLRRCLGRLTKREIFSRIFQIQNLANISQFCKFSKLRNCIFSIEKLHFLH